MKSRFVKGSAASTLGLDSQNQSALKKIRRERPDYVDTPVIPTNPHALFDEKAKFSTPVESSSLKEGEGGGAPSTPPSVPDTPMLSGTSLLDKYPLSSGAVSSATVMLVSDPASETTVWEQNNRTQEEIEDTSDIDESIVTNGMNVVPAIARRNNGKIEIIEGSRRRESCIKNHKPLLVIVVAEMSDEDAKVIVVFGNEGRKDTNIFSRVEGYQLLLNGERPICRSKAALARRLGFQREWVSNLMLIGDIPQAVKACLSKKERNELPAKKAIRLAKMIAGLSDISHSALTQWAETAADVSVNDILHRIKGADTERQAPTSKVGAMQVLYEHDGLSVVQNKKMKGVLLQLPDGVDLENLEEDRLRELLTEALKKQNLKL